MNDSTREMITGIIIFTIIIGVVLFFVRQKDDDYYYGVQYYNTDGSANYGYIKK